MQIIIISSNKHKIGKEKLSSKIAQEKDIASSLKEFDSEHHPVGETLPIDQRVYRLKVLKTFLKAAVPLDTFRDILDENAMRLTDRRHMSDLIPFLRSQEQKNIKAEISGKSLSVIFDGTTRFEEALARFGFTIQQRLVRL